MLIRQHVSSGLGRWYPLQRTDWSVVKHVIGCLISLRTIICVACPWKWPITLKFAVRMRKCPTPPGSWEKWCVPDCHACLNHHREEKWNRFELAPKQQGNTSNTQKESKKVIHLLLNFVCIFWTVIYDSLHSSVQNYSPQLRCKTLWNNDVHSSRAAWENCPQSSWS